MPPITPIMPIMPKPITLEPITRIKPKPITRKPITFKQIDLISVRQPNLLNTPPQQKELSLVEQLSLELHKQNSVSKETTKKLSDINISVINIDHIENLDHINKINEIERFIKFLAENCDAEKKAKILKISEKLLFPTFSIHTFDLQKHLLNIRDELVNEIKKLNKYQLNCLMGKFVKSGMRLPDSDLFGLVFGLARPNLTFEFLQDGYQLDRGKYSDVEHSEIDVYNLNILTKSCSLGYLALGCVNASRNVVYSTFDASTLKLKPMYRSEMFTEIVRSYMQKGVTDEAIYLCKRAGCWTDNKINHSLLQEIAAFSLSKYEFGNAIEAIVSMSESMSELRRNMRHEINDMVYPVKRYLINIKYQIFGFLD